MSVLNHTEILQLYERHLFSADINTCSTVESLKKFIQGLISERMTVEQPITGLVGSDMQRTQGKDLRINSLKKSIGIHDKGMDQIGKATNPYVGLPMDNQDQHLASDHALFGTSPSSLLMYDNDMVEGKKPQLQSPLTHPYSNPFEPFSCHGSEMNPTRIGDFMSELEDMELSFENEKRTLPLTEIKTERPWSPAGQIDTGQQLNDFEYENVMLNKPTGQHGLTLAQLNNTSVFDEVSVLDDINSIISNDLKGQPTLSTLKLEPMSPTSVHSSSIAGNSNSSIGSVVKSSANQATDLSMTFNEAMDAQSGLKPRCASMSSIRQTMTPSHSAPTFTALQPVNHKHTAVKDESTDKRTQMTSQMPLFLSGTNFTVGNRTPQMEWSFQNVNNTVEKPSLLKLLASTDDDEAQEFLSGDSDYTVRRPVQVPKRTRGLSEGSGMTHLKEDSRSCSKRPGSPASFDTLVQEWEDMNSFQRTGAGQGGEEVTTPVKKIKTEWPGDGIETVVEESGEYGSDSDSDLDFSDTDSVGSHSSFVEELLVGGKKEKRFFWQYNTQAKGPKGKRLCKNLDNNDPHVPISFEDPVFDPEMNDVSYRHQGRARKGDGNDVSPSPWKLFQIGNQLKRLNRRIHGIVPASELPAQIRNDTRREKNKYASRACRLKKKAQHEANKIKLYGLDTEHGELMRVLTEVRRHITRRATIPTEQQSSESYSQALDRFIKEHLTVMIAGNTTDYVNSVLEKVAQGDRSGGLDIRRH